jgi:D-methionine transport system ATP-binding protein
MSVLRSACEEISILENGKIVESGPVGEIFLGQPKALSNITGGKDLILPETGTNIKILMSKELSDKPIITRMSRELQTDFMILGGETERYRDSILGSVIINVPDAALPRIVNYLDDNNVIWKRMNPSEYSDGSEQEDRYDA